MGSLERSLEYVKHGMLIVVTVTARGLGMNDQHSATPSAPVLLCCPPLQCSLSRFPSVCKVSLAPGTSDVSRSSADDFASFSTRNGSRKMGTRPLPRSLHPCSPCVPADKGGTVLWVLSQHKLLTAGSHLHLTLCSQFFPVWLVCSSLH